MGVEKEAIVLDAAIIVTYRCNAHCQMCNTWKYPSRKEEEITLTDISKLPDRMGYVNLTGGEPMLRDDIEEIVAILSKKARKVELSTNGYFTDRIVELARRFRDIRVRVSLEGLPKVNDEIRGLKNGFDHGLRTILRLKELGIKDIGFGMVIQDSNAGDLLDFYYLTKHLGIEFGQATPHNSFYFHKMDNKIADPEGVRAAVRDLIRAFLRSNKPKLWLRAYVNLGIIAFINDEARVLPCGAGTDLFFLDPYGDIYPCNVMEESMGNIRQATFEEIWKSSRAWQVREMVENCPQNCWMVGTARPAMMRHPVKPILWVVKNKARLLLGKDVAWC